MMQHLTWGNERLSLTFAWDDDSFVFLQKASADETTVHFDQHLPIVEMQIAGTGHWIANNRLIQTTLGRDLRYAGHSSQTVDGNHQLDITLSNEQRGLLVTVTYILPANTPMYRTYATVTNESQEPVSLESVTSWVGSFGAPENKPSDFSSWELTECNYQWLGEGRWHTTAMREYCPAISQQLTGSQPRIAHTVTSNSTWSTGTHAPPLPLSNPKLSA